MNKHQMESTEQLLALKFQRKQNLIVALNSQEAHLRDQIKKVIEQDKRAEQSASQQMRSIGADVIWKAWVGRTKENLNRELAQILAQKEVLLKDMRRDFGKVLVSREIVALETQRLRKSKTKDVLSQATDAFLFR